jgi:hypothetical protein
VKRRTIHAAIAGAVLGALAPGCGAGRISATTPEDASVGGRGPDFGLTAFTGDLVVRSCGAEPIEYRTRDADVVILLDRSGSMNTAFGGGTRYSVEAEILRDILPQYESRLRFGFQQFPSPGACPAGHVAGCCADRPSVGVATGVAADVLGGVDRAAPVSGNTPTAEALRFAREYYEALSDGVADRYVLLSTDGRPSCGADGRLPMTDDGVAARAAACADTLAEVDRLRGAGVGLIVLGLGAPAELGFGDGTDCLAEFARRGGVTRPDGQPALFSATDPRQLETALQQIFGGFVRPSCLVQLTEDPPDLDKVRVLLDGKEIPRNRRDGWEYEPREGRAIRIHGEYCRRLERFGVNRLEILYGCAPCRDPRQCE